KKSADKLMYLADFFAFIYLVSVCDSLLNSGVISFSSFLASSNHNSTNLTPSTGSIYNPSANCLAASVNEPVVITYPLLAFCLTILEWSVATGSTNIILFTFNLY